MEEIDILLTTSLTAWFFLFITLIFIFFFKNKDNQDFAKKIEDEKSFEYLKDILKK